MQTTRSKILFTAQKWYNIVKLVLVIKPIKQKKESGNYIMLPLENKHWLHEWDFKEKPRANTYF